MLTNIAPQIDEPQIKLISSKKLVGKHLTMTFKDNRTAELWRSFMPFRKQISNAVGEDLISLQVFDNRTGFNDPADDLPFEKWAAAEVTDFDSIPEGMEPFTLEGGLYAVFHYKGSSSSAEGFFRYIFTTWFPASEFIVDSRPHFEVIGEKYKNDDPSSEEEVWIPVKRK
jgi:AraC family transcriptional regulator